MDYSVIITFQFKPFPAFIKFSASINKFLTVSSAANLPEPFLGSDNILSKGTVIFVILLEISSNLFDILLFNSGSFFAIKSETEGENFFPSILILK